MNLFWIGIGHQLKIPGRLPPRSSKGPLPHGTPFIHDQRAHRLARSSQRVLAAYHMYIVAWQAQNLTCRPVPPAKLLDQGQVTTSSLYSRRDFAANPSWNVLLYGFRLGGVVLSQGDATG